MDEDTVDDIFRPGGVERFEQRRVKKALADKILIDRVLSGQEEVNHRFQDGQTALMLSQDLDTVKKLIKLRANVNLKNNNGMTALLLFIFNSKTDIVKELIKAGADVNLRSDDGTPPLLTVDEAGLENDKIILLLLKAGANINSQDSSGNTALMRAVTEIEVHATTTKLLIKNGADINLKNNKGKSAFDIALTAAMEGLLPDPAFNDEEPPLYENLNEHLPLKILLYHKDFDYVTYYKNISSKMVKEFILERAIYDLKPLSNVFKAKQKGKQIRQTMTKILDRISLLPPKGKLVVNLPHQSGRLTVITSVKGGRLYAKTASQQMHNFAEGRRSESFGSIRRSKSPITSRGSLGSAKLKVSPTFKKETVDMLFL